MGFHVEDWKWNVWQLDPKTGKPMKWLGQIQDPATGFAWLRKQGKNRNHYRINNVPPEAGPTQNPSYEVIAQSSNKAEDFDSYVGRQLPRKPEKAAPQKYVSRHDPVRGESPRRTVLAPAAKPDNSPEMQKVRKTAKAVLDQHKQDELEEFGEDQ